MFIPVTPYRGRFAPTPSGPLHFGSLFAAVISYLDARAHGGQWLVRIEDIDPPREQPGAAAAILKTLEAHGLGWDETESYQSNNTERYLHNLNVLQQRQRLFWCRCSRKDLAGLAVYPGTCRDNLSPMPDSAIRLAVTSEQDCFDDLFQGTQHANIKQQYGDVVVRRRDKLFAYQLAVVCDDIADNISHIIRGIDLMDSTYWQRELYRGFEQSYPEYGHFAVIHSAGSDQKLSKQNLAAAVNDDRAQQNLMQVFQLLEIEAEPAPPLEMLSQATGQWQRSKLFKKCTLHLPTVTLE
ncbi:tRNA glutamyl-Q(34) synthetase GluQRS [Reinekea marinisedimentorum]|uniref:Glutamyl-Q tRNA(Asp) synthetase n=1 Tax=Reinekea marinisedimentorum TaxID=230495 RepID=A0A4R3I8I9_9GAMM|nr:tRNA glutamyl-Q(34) synthetase GluQRS [Reinekea marinisedimentorum]TCS41632.1 glutamyl-Q tRNA(Asp) synthetase [Reinekea marinisedimentorum]